jgi:hypothetical protein
VFEKAEYNNILRSREIPFGGKKVMANESLNDLPELTIKLLLP